MSGVSGIPRGFGSGLRSELFSELGVVSKQGSQHTVMGKHIDLPSVGQLFRREREDG